MNRRQKYFANHGFGWYCISCTENAERIETNSRLMREGEAESKQPELSQNAMAKWSNADRTEVVCPNCGAVESVAD